MQNVSCVFSFQESNWISCQRIVFNLHKSYNLDSFYKTQNFNFSISQGLTELSTLAQEIFESRPDVIVFLDHQPHPLVLVALLISLYDEDPRPKFIFHIYGDFSLFYTSWEKLGHLLVVDQVDFIVPSKRQKLFFDRFLQSPNASVLCPFPVDEIEFTYRPELRDEQRLKWGIKEEEFVFLYTGRLSRQKRIYSTLKAFSKFMLSQNIYSCHLFLYGDSDSIGDPFLGKNETAGEYFRLIDRLVRSFPVEIRNNIHFMGSVSKKELQSVYQAADALVNLSVHNDEDYGMSVAEAQATGLPSILSDWGGFSSFRHPEMTEATSFVPVKIGEHSKILSKAGVSKAFNLIRKFDPIERKSLSDLSLRKHGIIACHEILKKNLQQQNSLFMGFSPFLEKVVKELSLSSSPYITETKKINNLYKEIYSIYVRAD